MRRAATLPDLLDARVIVLNSPPANAVPGARVRVSIRAANTGKAVWLTGRSLDERGVVGLGWEWKRDGTVVADSGARRELHLNVFPGDSMDLEASTFAPDAPGRYELEISLAAEIRGQASRPIGSPLTVPVTVGPSPARPAARRKSQVKSNFASAERSFNRGDRISVFQANCQFGSAREKP